MAIDHIGLIFFPQYIVFRIIGRLAFPLFAFGVSQGYDKTKDLFKYGQRLFVLALISQPIFYLSISRDYLNICFTLLLGLITIYSYDKIKNNFLKFSSIIFLLIASNYFNLEYGPYGILMVLFFCIFKKSPFLIAVQSLLIFLFVLSDFNQFINIFAVFAVLLAYYLKDYRLKVSKWALYIFYPLHLLVLYLIYILLLPLFK